MNKASINCITRLRVNADGDGVRSVIFMQCCPLDCKWCCNPETRKGNSFKTLTTKELYSYIEKDVHYFTESGGGVTFSGGEALLYADFVKSFCESFAKGFDVNIETSLYADKTALDKLIPVINEWYVDFKVFDKDKHKEYTGVSNEIIKNNLKYLSEKVPKDKIIITFPMIPEHNLDDGNLNKTALFLKALGLYRMRLHPYRKTNEKKHEKLGLSHLELPEISKDSFEDIKAFFENNGIINDNRQAIVEKDKCNYLKAIRQRLIARDGIPLTIPECTFTGRCKGTCPECEYELEFIHNFYKNREGV